MAHLAHRCAGLVDLARRGAEQPDVRVGGQERALAGQALGQREVVRVEPGHQVGAGEAERPVERAGEPGARLAMQAQPRIPRAGQQIGRRIGRAVVDHDQLQVAVRLFEHAADGGGDPPRAVVDRHEDGDSRRGHDVFRKTRLKYGSPSEGDRFSQPRAVPVAAKSGRTARRVRERAVARKKPRP
jgi:hypothetical protein